MKVVFVANRYAPALGGSEYVEQHLAEGLVARGHSVTVLATDFRHSHGVSRISPRRDVINGVSVHRFQGYRLRKDPFTISPGMYSWIVSHKTEYDVLVTFTYGYATSWVPALFKLFGLIDKPIIFHPHYGPVGTVNSLLVMLYDATLGMLSIRNAGVIVLLTSKYRDFFKKQEVSEKAISIIPPVVTPIPHVSKHSINLVKEKFSISDKPLTILSLGRVVEYKGIQFMLAGLAKLRASHFEVEKEIIFVIAGDGDFRKELENFVAQENLKNMVRFVGEVTNDEKNVLYRMADVFCLLSYSGESFGIVAAEAMSAGLPVIGSTRGAISEVVEDGVSGIMVNPFDVDAVADAVSKLSEDRIRESLSRNATKKAGNYSQNHVLTNYEHLLTRMVDR